MKTKIVLEPTLNLYGIESYLQFDNKPLKDIPKYYINDVYMYIKNNCEEMFADIFEVLDLSDTKFEIGFDDTNYTVILTFYDISDKTYSAIIDEINTIDDGVGESELFEIHIKNKQEWFNLSFNIIPK
jgi:hypothetical protein